MSLGLTPEAPSKDPASALRLALNGAYTPELAYQLADLSRLAYVEEGQLRSHLAAWSGLELVEVLEQDGVRALAVQAQGYAVLAFRGSLSHDEVLQDLQAPLADLGAGRKANAGFVRTFARIEARVRQILDRLQGPLFLAGHSLGGALAQLASLQLRSLSPGRLAACYTYGCPRLGNAALAQDLDQAAAHHLVHGYDIVPRLPPAYLSRYAPSRRLRHVHTASTALSPSAVHLATAAVYLAARFHLGRRAYAWLEAWIGPSWMVQDHHIAAYVATLECLLEHPRPEGASTEAPQVQAAS